MSIYKRGGVYWFDFRLNGQRIRESTKQSNKVVAINMQAERRLQILQGRILPRECPSFKFFVDEEFLPWSYVQHHAHPETYRRYKVSSKPLVRFFRFNLNEITTSHVEQFKIRRLKDCSAAGVNRDLAALRLILNFSVKQGYLERNPFKGVKMLQEGPGMMRIVSHEEEALYLYKANPLLRDIATLMLQTGMRPKEVYTIRKEDVNLKERFLFVPYGKTVYARRTIPLTDEAMGVLERRRKSPYIFPHRDKPDHPMVYCRSHEALAKKLNLTFRLYDLRHTFGSRAIMAGVDLPTLKEIMGHSSITLRMRYVHPTPEHKKEAFQKLQRFNTTHSFHHSAFNGGGGESS